jgi:hypothetical protein
MHLNRSVIPRNLVLMPWAVTSCKNSQFSMDSREGTYGGSVLPGTRFSFPVYLDVTEVNLGQYILFIKPFFICFP